MIIENPKLQSKTLRTLWLAVTMFMWLVYVYLWLPLISLLAWWFGYTTLRYHMVTLNGFLGLKSVFIGYFYVILAIGVLLVLWAKLEKLRFGQKNRRADIKAVTNQTVASHFNISAMLLDDMQAKKIVTVKFNQKGEVEDVEELIENAPRHTLKEVSSETSAIMAETMAAHLNINTSVLEGLQEEIVRLDLDKNVDVTSAVEPAENSPTKLISHI